MVAVVATVPALASASRPKGPLATAASYKIVDIPKRKAGFPRRALFVAWKGLKRMETVDESLIATLSTPDDVKRLVLKVYGRTLSEFGSPIAFELTNPGECSSIPSFLASGDAMEARMKCEIGCMMYFEIFLGSVAKENRVAGLVRLLLGRPSRCASHQRAVTLRPQTAPALLPLPSTSPLALYVRCPSLGTLATLPHTRLPALRSYMCA